MNTQGKEQSENIIKNQSNSHKKHTNFVKKTIQLPQYNIEASWKRMSKIRASPSRSFGKSARSLTQKVQAPGPGEYDLNKTSFSKGYVSFKGTKNIKLHTESPGPNAYKLIDLFASKKYSFTRSQQKDKIQTSPSPGTYETFIRHTSQSLSFTKSAKNQIVQKEKKIIPGPGNYKIVDNSKKQLNFSFTHTKKFQQSGQQINEKAKVPGPGSYDLANGRKSIKSTKFTKTIKNFIQDNKVPGPGAYGLQRSSLKSRGGILSSEKRIFSYQNGIPGPGNYNQVDLKVTKKSEVGIIIYKSRQTDSKFVAPGPADYNKQTKPKIMGGVIGTQSRKNHAKLVVSAYSQLLKTTGLPKHNTGDTDPHQYVTIAQDNQS